MKTQQSAFTALEYLVFFVVFASVLLQGASIPLVARWLNVITPDVTPQETLSTNPESVR